MYRFRKSGGRWPSENSSTPQRSFRERWYLFSHNRLWFLLPVVAIVSFLLFFLLCKTYLPFSEAVFRGVLAVVLMTFCWIVGTWVSTSPEVRPDEEESEEDWVDRLMQKGPVGVWAARIAVGLLFMVSVAAVLYPQLEALFTGSEPVLKCVIGILLKVLAVVAALLPVWLSRHSG